MPNPPPFALLHIDHVVLRMRDVAAMPALYRDVFGCTVELTGLPDERQTRAATAWAANR